jgi:integrase
LFISQEGIYQFFNHQLIFFIQLLHCLELVDKVYISELVLRFFICLLIYQALQVQEITGLQVEEVDLEAGTIYIGKPAKTHARTLKLEPRLIKQPTNQLLLTLRGSEEKGEGIGYLLETTQHLYPDRPLNARSIRQSVISNMLKAGKTYGWYRSLQATRK